MNPRQDADEQRAAEHGHGLLPQAPSRIAVYTDKHRECDELGDIDEDHDVLEVGRGRLPDNGNAGRWYQNNRLKGADFRVRAAFVGTSSCQRDRCLQQPPGAVRLQREAALLHNLPACWLVEVS